MTRLSIVLCVLVLSGCAAPYPPAGSGRGSPDLTSAPAEARIRATHAHLFHSRQVGDRFLIHVALPTVSTTAALPVVYVLDGNASFPLIAETARRLMQGGEIPAVLVVGIGYDTDDPEALSRLEARDFFDDDGARRLLAFVEQELKPFIATRYPADPRDTTLVGDSSGGLFALYVLFESPASFDRYIVGSPPLWWNDRVTFQREQRYAEKGSDLGARMFLSVGGLEENTADVERLTRLLRSRGYPGFALETVIFHGETHYSVVPAAFSRGLRFVFRPPADAPSP